MFFSLLDEARRQAGRLLGDAGGGPHEAPWRAVAEYDAARLRAYHDPAELRKAPALLLVPAPFKRHYVWDLMPGASVVRTCLDHGLRVYLLEWLLPRADQDDLGLDDYASRLIREACRSIEIDSAGRRPIIAGHSLGGTFVAMFASRHPGQAAGIILVDAPLSFGEPGDRLAHEIAIAPPARWYRTSFGSPVPGSAITLLCLAGLPDVFAGQPRADLLASLPDPHATAVHCHVLRWTLDEFPIPGRLFEQVFEQLYRRNEFMRGTLIIEGRRVGIDALRTPLLAVVNPWGGVVPPASLHAALQLLPDLPTRVLNYRSDSGSALQHIGPLATRFAHEQLWPEIIEWVLDQRPG